MQCLRCTLVNPWVPLLKASSARADAIQLTIALPRRLLRSAAQTTSLSAAPKKLVFLGTPEVAAIVLKKLFDASSQPEASFQVAMVVSQPGKPKGRGNRAVPVPSPVEQAARAAGLSDQQILCPPNAKQEDFLRALEAARPDLCVTAAYGHILPQRFLDIPTHGTLNIHPSLLPKYRGAAPVPRALEAGVRETGVSVAYTVLRCDAGPVLCQQVVPVNDDVQAPELLSDLFALGADLLLSRLEDVWSGRAADVAVPQDESAATHAPKMSRQDGLLNLRNISARTLHDRVRAFAGWPGTTVRLQLMAPGLALGPGAGRDELELKVLRTRLVAPGEGPGPAAAAAGEVVFQGGKMFLPCKGGEWLEALTVQPPARKATAARDFQNGLGGKRLLLSADADVLSAVS